MGLISYEPQTVAAACNIEYAFGLSVSVFSFLYFTQLSNNVLVSFLVGFIEVVPTAVLANVQLVAFCTIRTIRKI